MDFGQALAVVKNGGRVTRAAWSGGTFIYLVPGSTFQVNRPPLLGIYAEGTVINYRPHIDIRASDGTCSPWQPSQDSLMAEDWGTVPEGVAIQVNVAGSTVMSDDDARRLADKIGRRLRGPGEGDAPRVLA